jgi:hypothetical protein
MRTNSSATMGGNYSPYMDETLPSFDLSREVQRAYEDVMDAASRYVGGGMGGWMHLTPTDRSIGVIWSRIHKHFHLTFYMHTNAHNPNTARST